MKKVLASIAIAGAALALGACAAPQQSQGQGTTAATVPAATFAAPTTATTPPTAPGETAEQAQAVLSAREYLNLGSGFSRASLIQQLTSSAEGFSASDATYAIDSLNPDWNAQAVESAQDFLRNGGGFSRTGLIQQLNSPFGGGFTYAQAVYGVTAAGL